MVIRPATAVDAPAVIDLIGAVYAEYGFQFDAATETPDLLDFESTFAGGAFFVGTAAGEIIGSVGLERVDEQTGELVRLYLDARFRGLGYGRRLLETAVDWAHAHAIRRIFLWTDTRFQDAHRLYRRAGFYQRGIRRVNDVNDTVEYEFIRDLQQMKHRMTDPTKLNPQSVLALRDIARALSGTQDLDATLDLIVHKTTDLMRVDSCTLYLLDPDGQTLRLRASTGLARRALGRATLRIGEGMTGYAVQRNQPVHAADASTDPHFKWVEVADEERFRSLLAAPLVIGSESKAIGALNVQTRAVHAYTDTEIELLSLIADLAAGALGKTQLLDRQAQQLAEMRALAAVSEVITSPQFLDDILNVVTDMAAKTMNAAVCSIFLLNEAGTHLEMHAARHPNTSYAQREPLPLGAGVMGEVARTGKAVYVPNVQTAVAYLGKERAREEGLVSLLSVPLSVRDRVIGVFNCYTTIPRIFTHEQRALFLTLANQTALAIENARLVTHTAVIREMHHRIKNNLQTVAMLMQLQLPDANRLDTREVLQTNIHRIRSIATVHEVLSERGFRLVDVKDVLQRIVQATRVVMANQSVRIDVIGESLSLPSRAATSLTLVVNELVQNGLEHAFVGRENGRIEVSLGRSADELIVLVKDDGRGFPPDLEKGLGLEIAETLVGADLRGRLKYNRPEGGGSEISIRMPRAIEHERE